MPSLKDLRNRINSVKSTQKITAAMKMVAAAKLRRAQEQAMAARPYAERMERMLGSLAQAMGGQAGAPQLLAGTGKSDVHLVVVMTSDRGLCGSFNSSIVREARKLIRDLLAQGRQVKILCVGRKGRDQLRRDFGRLIVATLEEVGRRKLAYADAQGVAERIRAMFDAGEFDVATLVYNRFRSAMSQTVTVQQVIPFAVPAGDGTRETGLGNAIYEYEPGEDAILGELLPRNIGVQVFRALLENAASEHGARMTAMDSATRNAGEMIAKLTLNYNRTRQAYITKELIEIISGAEAL
ncbi:MAG: atpG [Rhodospirillales bacterium]|jgi:F-type H+-transporting ATPase subunit gamma|nr:atpG [Rhodospirillales bacterium]